jgi:hypothetical protein
VNHVQGEIQMERMTEERDSIIFSSIRVCQSTLYSIFVSMYARFDELSFMRKISCSMFNRITNLLLSW